MYANRRTFLKTAAAARYRLPAPVDTDDLLQNGKGAMLATLLAAAADGPSALYLQEGAVQHAPLVNVSSESCFLTRQDAPRLPLGTELRP